MFISPITAINEGWITHPECKTLQDWQDRKFISPNAIDFTVDQMFSIDESNVFIISEDRKEMRTCTPVPTVTRTNGTFWELDQGKCYDVMSDVYVNIPHGVVAFTKTRSTFVRNGSFIQNGFFDSKFSGNIGSVLFNLGGKSFIAPHTRIAQIIFANSDNFGEYAGGYNSAPGKHWSQNTKH